MKGIFLNNNKTYKLIKIPDNAHEVIYNRGLYAIDPREIQNFIDKKKDMKDSLILWFESSPNPIPIKTPKPGVIQQASKRTTENAILENFLDSAGESGQKKRRFNVDRLNLGQLMRIGVVILIFGAVIWGYIYG